MPGQHTKNRMGLSLFVIIQHRFQNGEVLWDALYIFERVFNFTTPIRTMYDTLFHKMINSSGWFSIFKDKRQECEAAIICPA